MKATRIFAVVVVVAFLALASSAFAVGPGKKADPVPPKLQSAILSDEMLWDRPEAFGPVPKKQQALGKKVCGPGKKAIGYHPKAQDKDGKKFPKGGFLCVPK